MTALAATAGVAIANARLYDVARVRQDWLSASATITRRLLSTDPGDPLQLVVNLARDVAHADLVAVVLPAQDGDGLRVEVAVGSGAHDVVGVRIPVAGSLCGRVLTTGRPLRDSWPQQVPGLGSVVSAALDLDPILIIPLVDPGRSTGSRSGQPGRCRERAARDWVDHDNSLAIPLPTITCCPEVRPGHRRRAGDQTLSPPSPPTNVCTVRLRVSLL